MVSDSNSQINDKIDDSSIPYYEGGTGYTQEDIERLRQQFGPQFDEEQMKILVEQIREANSRDKSKMPKLPGVIGKHKDKNRKNKQRIQKASRKNNR